MKIIKALFLVAFTTLLTGCKSDPEPNELCSHLKLGVELFSDALSKEASPQILDYRSTDDYNKGHIPGAISMPASTTDLVRESEYFKKVREQFSTSKKIFIYGGTASWGVNGNVIPGIIACDWGKDKAILLDGGYNAWANAGNPTE